MKKRSSRLRSAVVSPGDPLLGDYLLEDVHVYRLNRHTFTVYVGGDPHAVGEAHVGLGEPGVEYHMADRFEINLQTLSAIDPSRPILVVVASCGGHWEAGMQMFSAILACPNPVTVLAVKSARSMTSLIPLAADKFVIRPAVQYMFHRGTFAFAGLDQEAETAEQERRKANELMLRMYTARLKEQGKHHRRSETFIRTLVQNKMKEHIDVWLSATDAVEWGFADAVYDGNESSLRTTRNKRRRGLMYQVLTKPIAV